MLGHMCLVQLQVFMIKHHEVMSHLWGLQDGCSQHVCILGGQVSFLLSLSFLLLPSQTDASICSNSLTRIWFDHVLIYTSLYFPP